MSHGATSKVNFEMMRMKFFEVSDRVFARYRVLAVFGLVAALVLGGSFVSSAQDGEATEVVPYRFFPHTGEIRPVTNEDKAQWASAVARGLITTVTGGSESNGKGADGGADFEFIIVYGDLPGFGFNDFTEGADRRARLEETLGYVGDTLNFSGTLDIFVDESLNDPFTGLLAQAGPDINPSLEYTNGEAFERLATGIDTFPGTAEIYIRFNFGHPWYAGTGQTPVNQFDLVAVLLHEVTHALGFLDLADPNGVSFLGPGGTLSVFDQFLIRGTDGEPLFGGAPPGLLLDPTTLTSNNVAFDGEGAIDGYSQGVDPPIYAPNPYQGGSSISHWDTNTILAVLGSAVMTHAVASGPADREYTALDLGAMGDIGYDTTPRPRRFRGAPLENLQGLHTRELVTPPAVGDPVIVLTWDNPGAPNASTVVQGVTLLRSLREFATEATAETILEIGGADFEAYVDHFDSDIPVGTDLWYTVIADLGENFRPQLSFARVRVGSTNPAPLVEAFGPFSDSGQLVGEALSFSQLLFSPLGGPVGLLGSSSSEAAGANGYETTLLEDVRQLPVARNDANGNSFTIPILEEGVVGWSLGPERFPFFGTEYSTIFVAANGYVSFEPVFLQDSLNFPSRVTTHPSLESHYGIPRVSMLFSDLAPDITGEIWLRMLNDRVVVTYENIASDITSALEFPKMNTFQVALFFSGHIQITYQELLTESDVIVGLSAGLGIPFDPADEFDVESVTGTIGLDEVLGSSDALSIVPIASQNVSAGDLVAFDVVTVGGSGAPLLSAEWDGPGLAPFVSNGDGTGVFLWRTGVTDAGLYLVRILARSGDEEAFQDVRIFVGFVPVMPTADNLRIVSDGLVEGSNVVDVDNAMTTAYDYAHPLGTEEGRSFITWHKNGQFVAGLTDSRTVPSSATQSGDRWHFRVIPVSDDFELGLESVSPVVTIDGAPRIESVSPSVGTSFGGTTVLLEGTRMGVPLSVMFGGVEVQSIRSFGDGTLEVVTPFFNIYESEGNAQLVTIEVVTTNGSGVLQNGFTYVDGPPTIESIAPNAGPFEGGTPVMITGILLTGVSTVLFDGIPGGSLTVNGAGTEITVTTPLLADDREDQTSPRVPVAVDMKVLAAHGMGTKVGGFTYGGTATTDLNSDGKVDAVDVQIVINSVLDVGDAKLMFNADANRDGAINASDVQLVINAALRR